MKIINKNFSLFEKVSFSIDGEILNFAGASEKVQDEIGDCPYKSEYVKTYPKHRQKYSAWLRQNYPDSFKRKSENPKQLKLADQALARDIKNVATLAKKVGTSDNPREARSKVSQILTSKGAKIFYGIAAGAALAALGSYLAAPSIKNAIQNNKEAIKGAINKARDSAKSIGSNIQDKVKDSAKSAGKHIQDAANKTKDYLADKEKSAKSGVKSAGKYISDKASEGYHKLRDTETGQKAAETYHKGKDYVTDKASKAGNYISDKAKAGYDASKYGLKTSGKYVADKAKEGYEATKSGAAKAGDYISDKVKSGYETAKSEVKAGSEKINKLATNVQDKFKKKTPELSADDKRRLKVNEKHLKSQLDSIDEKIRDLQRDHKMSSPEYKSLVDRRKDVASKYNKTFFKT